MLSIEKHRNDKEMLAVCDPSVHICVREDALVRSYNHKPSVKIAPTSQAIPSGTQITGNLTKWAHNHTQSV
jgi:hypothetical protein